jgi:hypothetical protein
VMGFRILMECLDAEMRMMPLAMIFVVSDSPCPKKIPIETSDCNELRSYDERVESAMGGDGLAMDFVVSNSSLCL